MITKIYLEGFKSFGETTVANINQLTVIAGANSCGKTSLIQVLLLLAQTLENPRSEVAFDLGGRFIQFAELREAVFGRPKNIEARFVVGFDLEINEPDIQDTNIFIQKYTRRLVNPNQPNSVLGTLNKAKFRVGFRVSQLGTPLVDHLSYEKEVLGVGTYRSELQRQKKNYKMIYEFQPLRVEKTETKQIIEELQRIFRQEFESSKNSNILLKTFDRVNIIESLQSPGNIDELLQVLLYYIRRRSPSKATQWLDELSTQIKEIQEISFRTPVRRSAIVQPQFDHFFFSPSRLGGVNQNESYLFEKFNEQFQIVEREIKGFLRSIQYVGPLRAKPERAYLSTGTPIEIGNAGENAIPILWVNQNEKVINKTKIGEHPRVQNLADAVKSWLGEFGIASSFHITKPKRVIYQAEMESNPGSKVMVTIADVGFGVSQLLPVIVAGLWSKPGSTLILEQPEIHLHPRLQGKLADFLICLAELDKKVIVETHSEHIINMLRLRIIQDKTGLMQKRIGILFVRSRDQIQTNKQGDEHIGSYIENLKVDEYGKISNWPPDFFPEASQINEEILRAMLDKSIQGSKK